MSPRLVPGRRRLARTGAWLLGSLVVVALALVLVDVAEATRAVAGADRRLVLVVGVATLAVLVARGLALWVVLGVLERPVTVGRALGVYAAVTFVNSVVPSGQAGGAPVTGLLVARAAGADYEDGVATVVIVAALANLMVGLFGVAGLGYILAAGSPGTGLVRFALGGLALFAAAALAVAGLWRARVRVAAAAVAALTALAGAVGRVVPGVTPPDRAEIARRVARFGHGLGRLRAGGPRRLALLFGLTALAHATSVLALWLAFVALGYRPPFGVLLAVIPAAVLVAVVPLPGGLGGVDLALVGLLAVATATPVAAVGAAVLIYRAAAFWPRIAIGGAVAAGMAAFGWLS